jgi:hypothetical protein
MKIDGGLIMKYTVKQYFNGIHCDNSYTNDRAEAEEWKAYMEDNSRSVWDRVNYDALDWFVEDYKIANADVKNIVITVEIVEE